MNQKNLNINLNEKMSESTEVEFLDTETVKLYSKLNEKCDNIIGKIKVRKAKKKVAA